MVARAPLTRQVGRVRAAGKCRYEARGVAMDITVRAESLTAFCQGSCSQFLGPGALGAGPDGRLCGAECSGVIWLKGLHRFATCTHTHTRHVAVFHLMFPFLFLRIFTT